MAENSTKPTILPLLVVDDERSFTDLLAQIMGDNLDCPIVAFNRPSDAVNFIRNQKIGVLVTDYYMPGMNGIELIRALQDAQPGTPAVLITGHNLNLNPAERAKLPSLRNVLSKPFGWRKLAEEVLRFWPEGIQKPKIKDAS